MTRFDKKNCFVTLYYVKHETFFQNDQFERRKNFQLNKKSILKIDKPFDKRSTLSKRPSTFDRNESKSNGAASP